MGRLLALVLVSGALAMPLGGLSGPSVSPARVALSPADPAEASHGAPAPAPVGPAPAAGADPARPHPAPIPLGRPSFTGHYYAGAVYDGKNGSASTIAMTLAVPRDTPTRSDFYYVLASAWDDAGSYDQFGFTSGGGDWGVSYSTTTFCAGSYSFSTDAFNLTAGVAYTFSMSASLGAVLFTVSEVGVGSVWSYSTETGGTSFVISSTYECQSSYSLDYTDYEEVYDTAAPVPPYDVVFANNTVDGNPSTDWAAIAGGGAPQNVPIVIDRSTVSVENEPYALSFPSTLPAELSGGPSAFSLRVSVSSLGAATSVTLSESGALTGLTGSSLSFGPTGGTTPFSSNLTLHLAAGTTTTGSFPIEVVARDPSGTYAELAGLVVVNAQLNASPPVVSPAAVDVNQTISVSELPSGGVGPFQYRWLGLPDGCYGSSGDLRCRPLEAGSTNISVAVVDALGFASNSSVIPLDVSPLLAATISSNRSAIDVGQSVGFTLSPSGGSGGDRVDWSGGGSGCVLVATVYSCRSDSAGSLRISANVTDSNGASVVAAATPVVVSPDPVVAVAFHPTLLDLGMTFSGLATASGGFGGFNLTWHGLPADCAAPTGASFSCRTAIVGYFAVFVSAVDANGGSNSSAIALLTVNPDPAVQIRGSATSVLEGAGVSWTAELAGGSGGWSYHWSGLPDGCAANDTASIACTPGASGQYTIRLVVTDATGSNGSATAFLTVTPAVFGLSEAEGVGVVLVAVALVAVGIGLLVRRRRPRRSGPAGAPAPRDGRS